MEIRTRPRVVAVRPDRRLLAIGDMLSHAADVAARPGADPRDASDTMIAVAADVYSLAFGRSGALDVPPGMRLPARVVRVLERATGALDADTAKGGENAAA